MDTLGKFLQSGDWKGEKHVPVIHVPEKVNAEEGFELRVSIGDAVKHPNTLEHHIVWFKVFYKEDGGKFPVELVLSSVSKK
jgi:superoxide reductase